MKFNFLAIIGGRKMEVTKLKKKINSINNWFKKNTKKEEKIFRQWLLAFSIFIICNDILKSI